MNSTPEPDSVGDALGSSARDLGVVADALGDQVRPIAKLGVDTAHNVVTAAESVAAAGRGMWRAVKFLDSLRPGANSAPEPVTTSKSPALPEPAGVPAESPPITDSGGIGSAMSLLGPTAILNTVRRLGGAAVDVPGRVIEGMSGHEDVDLRQAGSQLIARSQRPQAATVQHPAFAKIIVQLYPDEARMVRFLQVAGSQPAIDIRTKTLFQVGSVRLASRINMVAEMSSCRWPKHSEFYLGNLERLGLVVYSTEPVEDFRRYALMEVQPRALEIFEGTGHAISIYRSILLTQFGREFSEACFDVSGYHAGGWDDNDRGDRIKGSGPPEPKTHKH